MKKVLILILITTNLFSITIENLGFNLGTSHMGYSQSDSSGSIILGDEPDERFSSFELFSTSSIFEDKSLKAQVSYIYSDNDEFVNHTLLVGYNQYQNLKDIDTYVGLLAGYGQLRWGYDPLSGSKGSNKDTDSPIVGLQLGFKVPVDKYFDFNVNTRYLIHQYETYLNSGTARSKLTHNYTASFSLGFIYKF